MEKDTRYSCTDTKFSINDPLVVLREKHAEFTEAGRLLNTLSIIDNVAHADPKYYAISQSYKRQMALDWADAICRFHDMPSDSILYHLLMKSIRGVLQEEAIPFMGNVRLQVNLPEEINIRDVLGLESIETLPHEPNDI